MNLIVIINRVQSDLDRTNIGWGVWGVEFWIGRGPRPALKFQLDSRAPDLILQNAWPRFAWSLQLFQGRNRAADGGSDEWSEWPTGPMGLRLRISTTLLLPQHPRLFHRDQQELRAGRLTAAAAVRLRHTFTRWPGRSPTCRPLAARLEVS